jgi:hypothetical protein
VVFLDARRLLNDTVVCTGDLLREEAFPLGVREGKFVKSFELAAEVRNERRLAGDAQVLVCLLSELGDEVALEPCLTLVGGLADHLGHELGDNRALVGERDRLITRRGLAHDNGLGESGTGDESGGFWEREQPVAVEFVLSSASIELGRERD